MVSDRYVWRQLSLVPFDNGNLAVPGDSLASPPPAGGRPVVIVAGGGVGVSGVGVSGVGVSGVGGGGVGGQAGLAGTVLEDALAAAARAAGAVLVDGGIGRDLGGDTGALVAAVQQLAGPAPVAVVLAGGGADAQSVVLAAVRRRWPVFILAGTGGTADVLARRWTEFRVRVRRRAAPLLRGQRKYRPRPPLSAITDPDLREITSQGDIRLVTGAEPSPLARPLAWELQAEPVLKDAWQQFATYDQMAVRLRGTFTRSQGLILLLGVAATLLGLIDNQVNGAPLHWAAIAVPILISVLIAVASRRAFGQRWVVLRAAAESIKAEIYQYRTRGTTAAGASRRAGDTAAARLAARLEAVDNRLLQTEASSGPLPPYRGPLPPEMYGAARDDDGLSPLAPDRYLAIRVGDQLSYYHQRIDGLNRRRNLLQVLAIASGAAGAILAAAQLEVWIGLTAGASAAALAYLGYLQVDNTIVTYNQTAARLAGQRRRWLALQPSQRSQAAVRRLVTACEGALAAELSGWVQQMNDAMEDLRQDQADEAARVDPGEDGPGEDGPADDGHERSADDGHERSAEDGGAKAAAG